MRTVIEIMNAGLGELDRDELRVKEAFVDLAELLARYNDVLASGHKHGFALGVTPELAEAMRQFKPHFGRIDNALVNLVVLPSN